jgi:F0F1-type ATP synthase assembly protein I
MLSEDTKLENLRQRIIDVARNERNGLLIFQMGVVLASAGVIISVLGNNIVSSISGIFFVILGTLSTVFGFYVSVHYAHQYNNLLKELDSIVNR